MVFRSQERVCRQHQNSVSLIIARMQQMVYDCRNSGVTVRAWYASQGISGKSYYYRSLRRILWAVRHLFQTQQVASFSLLFLLRQKLVHSYQHAVWLWFFPCHLAKRENSNSALYIQDMTLINKLPKAYKKTATLSSMRIVFLFLMLLSFQHLAVV